MTTTFQANLTDKTYNGWTNYATWNVALWIQNDQFFSDLRDDVENFGQFIYALKYAGDASKTPDGVEWEDADVNVIEIDNELFSA